MFAMNEVELMKLIENSAAETRRHFDVVAEGLRQNSTLALEGVTSNGQRLDRLAVDMKEEFAEVRSMIRFSFAELERRVAILETGFSRIERLEARIHDLESRQ
jgi:hypothetical protein